MEKLYRQPILDLFISCKDWPIIQKCLDSSTRKQFRKYLNVKGQAIKDLYPYQMGEFDRLAATMADSKAKWAKRYREIKESQQIPPRHRQLELWQVLPTIPN